MSNYVDNKRLLDDLTAYRERRATNPDEVLPEYVGYCILEIAKRFASRPNFYNYTYRDEMIGDAIENCIQYMHNFDPEKSQNPFGYITQICYYAFIARITREKKQSYIKSKLISEMPFDSYASDFEDEESKNSFMAYVQSNNQFDHSSFEKPPAVKKQKQKKLTALDELMMGEE